MLKCLRIAKMKIYIFLAPAQRNWMQPIFVSYKTPFRSNLQKNTGPVGAGPHWTSRLVAFNFFEREVKKKFSFLPYLPVWGKVREESRHQQKIFRGLLRKLKEQKKVSTIMLTSFSLHSPFIFSITSFVFFFSLYPPFGTSFLLIFYLPSFLLYFCLSFFHSWFHSYLVDKVGDDCEE